ncbi:MAG: imidazoleglycerol-phosphate dehydratase [Planctomycetota bacterium]
MTRAASVTRNTNETQIALALDLDGGAYANRTGVGFFDHMLDHIAKHGRLGLTVTCTGDTHVDDHHTVEDVGLALGDAIQQAVGDKRGIERYGFASVPMDDALAQVTLDLSGRPALVYHAHFTNASGSPLDPTEVDEGKATIPGLSMSASGGAFDLQLVREFFNAVANAAAMNLHVTTPHGHNNHHLCEAMFKAFGRALRQAVAITHDEIPSTKGTL